MKKKIIIVALLMLIGGGGYYAYTQRLTAIENGALTLYGNVDIREVSLVFGRPAGLPKCVMKKAMRLKPAMGSVFWIRGPLRKVMR